MAEEDSHPCSLDLTVPFPTARLATTSMGALAVDKELSPLVRRTFAVEPLDPSEPEGWTTLRIGYRASTNRMLRVAVNSFLDYLAFQIEVMEQLDVDVLAEGAVYADTDIKFR